MPYQYTGPVPPIPTANSTDAVWQSHWAHQTLLRDIRYENFREEEITRNAARQVVLDAQHAEKMVREAACAAATAALAASNERLAEAQKAGAAALVQAQTINNVDAPKTDEQMVQDMLPGMLAEGMLPLAAMDRARQTVAGFRFFYKFKVPA